MLSFAKFMLLFALAAAAYGQDHHDWQSVSQLHKGDRVRLSSKTGSVSGAFQNWTPQNLTVGTVTTRREDVLRIELYKHGGSRTKHTAVGALIGFGGGFAIGAAAYSCSGQSIGPCLTRPEGGAIVGGAGAIIGALVGALLPLHSKELVYSAK